MADLKQGVEYELTAKDATKPGVDSAKATVEEGAKAAAKSTEEVAKEFKGGFSPMAAITAALTGNFNALGQQLMGLVSRLKNVHVSMMQFTLYAALITATVKAVNSLIGYFDQAAQRAEAIKLDNASATLEAMKKDSADFADAMERARKETESVFEAQNREVSSIQALTQAYNEFAKAQEPALAKTDEERKSIETRYKSTSARNDREVSAAQRRLEREKLDADLKRMREELEEAQDSRAEYAAQAEDATRRASRAVQKAQGIGFWSWWKNNGDLGGDRDIQNATKWNAAAESALEETKKADERIADLKLKIEDAEDRRAALDVKEEAALYSAAAELQTELNEAWAEADEAEKKEIEGIREAAVAAAEEVKEAQLTALKEVKDTRMRDLQEATQAESDAQQRLAAARHAVDRAWGWYRNKDSLRAQLEEEKADAAAREQYEKDFEKLKFRRDWREAKNLSLDQEAVRRVALAREEEASAQRAVAETAENTRRAAEALEVIETAFEEGGE